MQKTFLPAVPIEQIVPWDKNPRDISPQALARLKNKINDLGQFKPLLCVYGSGNLYCVICGNQRLKAAKELGLKTMDVLLLPQLTDKKQILKIALADNESDGFTVSSKLAGCLAEAGLDAAVLADYSVKVEDGSCLSIEAAVAPALLACEEEQSRFDQTPEVAQGPAKTQTDDIILLGRHRLICADATDARTISRLMDGVKADCVLTDPPYGIKLDTDFTHMGAKKGKKYRRVLGDNDDFKEELILCVFKHFPHSKEVILFGPDYYHRLLPQAGSWHVWDKRAGLEEVQFSLSPFELLYSRQKHAKQIFRVQWFGFGGLSAEPDKEKKRVHPTQKPVKLLLEILEEFAKNLKTVADVYAGSGSTLAACELSGRTAYLAEIDPLYCDVIVKRYKTLMGNGADIYILRKGTKLPFDKVFGER